jgi:hypothetical protein
MSMPKRIRSVSCFFIFGKLDFQNKDNNLSLIKNIYHRKSDLFKICFKNSERISGYLEAFLKRRLYEDDFFQRISLLLA